MGPRWRLQHVSFCQTRGDMVSESFKAYHSLALLPHGPLSMETGEAESHPRLFVTLANWKNGKVMDGWIFGHGSSETLDQGREMT